MKKILAVASEGGHWKQLCRLAPFLNEYKVYYVTTNKLQIAPLNNEILYVNDANKEKKIQLLILFFRSLIVFYKIRPDFVITTGAAPGLIMVLIAYIFRIKSVWIDSIANANELSLSGKISKRFATYTLSQWREVALKENVYYEGSVIK